MSALPLVSVPQGSILLFLLYVNDLPHTVKFKLLLYVDDTCLIYRGRDIKAIKDQLDKDFYSLQ